MSALSIRQVAQQKITNKLVKSGLMHEMQASYIEKVCLAAQESEHPAFQANIRLPSNSAQEIAKEIVLQYLLEHKMDLTEKCINSESKQQFSSKQDKNTCARQLNIRNPTNVVHDLVDKWKKSGKALSLRPSPEENSAIHTMISDTLSNAEQQAAVVSRNAKVPEEDFTIGTGKPTTATGNTDDHVSPWVIPPKKPLRSKPKEMQYSRPTALAMQEQTLTKYNTNTADKSASTTEDNFTPTPPEPIIKRKVKKSRGKRSKKAQVQLPDEGVQVTLTNDETPEPEKISVKNHSSTETYNTEQTQPITNYTYTYDEITIPRQTNTGDSQNNTIPTTDTFDHQLVKEKPPRSSTASRTSTRSGKKSIASQKSTQSRNSYASKPSTHSRHSTVSIEGASTQERDAEPVSRQLNASKRSKKSTNTTGEYSTTSSTRKKVPPPSLPQPGTQTGSSSQNQNYSNNQNQSYSQNYSQDTFNRRAKISPLGEFLGEQNQEPNKSLLQTDNSTPGVSINVLSAGKSDTASASKKSTSTNPQSPKSYSEQSYTDYGLNSDELGDVQMTSDKFKSDAVSDEKMASDEKLWSRSRQ